MPGSKRRKAPETDSLILLTSERLNWGAPPFNRMDKSPSSKLLFLFLAIPVCIALVIILHKRRQDPYKANQTRYGLPSPDIHREWAHRKFTDIKNDPSFLAELKKTPIVIKEPSSPLTSIQREQLEESLRLFILAYHSGDYEEYLHFRTPVPAKCDEAKNRSDKEWLAMVMKRDIEDKDVNKLMWEVRHGTNEYWKGISLETASIMVQQALDVPEDLTKYALSVYHWGSMTIQPSFNFDRQPQDILKNEQKLTYATGSFVILPVLPDPPALVHIRFYWESTAQKWLPWQLVISHNGNFKKLPVF